jgi:hypothetical protein
LTRFGRCRTIAARPARCMMSSPTCIVPSPRLSWIGSIQGTFAFSVYFLLHSHAIFFLCIVQTSADTTLDLPAYKRVPRTRLDGIEGEGQLVVAPVAPSSSAGASCMTCVATIHTARCPRRLSAAARHRTRHAQGLKSHCPPA